MSGDCYDVGEKRDFLPIHVNGLDRGWGSQGGRKGAPLQLVHLVFSQWWYREWECRKKSQKVLPFRKRYAIVAQLKKIFFNITEDSKYAIRHLSDTNIIGLPRG